MHKEELWIDVFASIGFDVALLHLDDACLVVFVVGDGFCRLVDPKCFANEFKDRLVPSGNYGMEALPIAAARGFKAG